MKNFIIIFALIATLSTVALAAQDASVHHTGDRHTEQAATDVYAPAMDTMHKDMMIAATGDADIDFARGMIPHHQGAVEMAKILQEHGKDPELKKLADDIIAAQEKEIAFLKDWLEKKGY